MPIGLVTCTRALRLITSYHNHSPDLLQPHIMVQNLTFNASRVKLKLRLEYKTVNEASKNEIMPRLRKSTLLKLIVIFLAGGLLLVERYVLDSMPSIRKFYPQPELQ